jgi:hypothetical protein
MKLEHSLEKTALLEVNYFLKICYEENSDAVYLAVLLSLYIEIQPEYHVDFADGGKLIIAEIILTTMACCKKFNGNPVFTFNQQEGKNKETTRTSDIIRFFS